MNEKKMESLKEIMKVGKKKKEKNKKLLKYKKTNIRINHTIEERENELKLRELLENW
jgi:hypothetical protein